MYEYVSSIGNYIERFLDYRDALGYSSSSYLTVFRNLDCFCELNYPETTTLTQEMVHHWLTISKGKYEKAAAARLLGKYMNAIGVPAYVLPEKFITPHHNFNPYIFTDAELRRLFGEIDRIPAHNREPFVSDIAPVLFRLIYTCGLRPNEGRELLCKNVHLNTGEILITNTKKKKERMVVMSEDMCNLMKEYDNRRMIFGYGNEYWFPSMHGGPLSATFQTNLFKSAWQRANPDIAPEDLPSVRVYDLRHRFASAALVRWLEQGESLKAKLPYLRAYMGHSTLSETYTYIHILPENLTQTSAIDWDGFYDIIPEVQDGQEN